MSVDYVRCIMVCRRVCEYHHNDIVRARHVIEVEMYSTQYAHSWNIIDPNSIIEWSYTMCCRGGLIQEGCPPWEAIYGILVRLDTLLIQNERIKRLEDETLVEVTIL